MVQVSGSASGDDGIEYCRTKREDKRERNSPSGKAAREVASCEAKWTSFDIELLRHEVQA
jgi:hypothetical protein